MDINKMTKEELELLSYNDIAYQILKLEKKVRTTAELFKEIQRLLELSDEEYINKIGVFYTTLTTDKRFYSVGKGLWDLKERNIVKVVIDDDDDEEIEVDDEAIEEKEIETEEEEIIDKDFSDDDIDEDDLEEFGIAEEDIVEEDNYND